MPRRPRHACPCHSTAAVTPLTAYRCQPTEARMAINRKPCALCKSPVDQGVLPLLEGTEESCRVTLSNVPIMLCAEGHKRLLYSNFVMELMDTLAQPETAGLRVGEKRGIFRKRFRCIKCSSDIQGGHTAIAEFRASLRLRDMTDSVSVALTAPVMRCSSCGGEQLADERSLMQVFKALTRAFRSADVRPQ